MKRVFTSIIMKCKSKPKLHFVFIVIVNMNKNNSIFGFLSTNALLVWVFKGLSVILIFTPPICFSCRGHQDLLDQRETRWAVVMGFITLPEIKPDPCDSYVCVLQGEKGIGLAGPPGRVGPQGLKVGNRACWIAQCGSSDVPLRL